MSVLLIGPDWVPVEIDDVTYYFNLKERCECCGYLWSDCCCNEWPTVEEERARMSEAERQDDESYERSLRANPEAGRRPS